MKIVFIQQNGLQESLGIACLSAFIKQHGHECSLYLEQNEKDLIGLLEKEGPDLIGFSCLTGIHKEVIRSARFIKERLRAKIIIGGPHPTFFPEMIELDGVDIICRSEGEFPLLELLNNMSAGSDISGIKNLWVKENGRIYKNELRPLVANLDEFPLPDRELYYKYDFLKNMGLKRFMSGYGCPFPCTFCHEPLLRKEYMSQGGNFIRKKSVDRVIREIEAIKEKYPLKHVHFSDDLFYLNLKWLQEFSEKYKEKIALPFTCSLRFDSINERTIVLLKGACCFGAQVGLETGNENLRNILIKKRCSNEQVIKGAKLLHEYGIKLLTTNMIGLPGETLEQAFETVELNARIKADFARALSFMAFPKVELIEYAKAQGYLEKDYGIDNYLAEPQAIALPTKYANEFKNICSLFFLMVKTPFLMPFYRKLVKFPDNLLFRLIGAMNILQEIIFFQIDLKSGLGFFKNTFISKNGGPDFQWLPRIFKKERV